MLTWEITQIYHRYLKGRLIKLVKSLAGHAGGCWFESRQYFPENSKLQLLFDFDFIFCDDYRILILLVGALFSCLNFSIINNNMTGYISKNKLECFFEADKNLPYIYFYVRNVIGLVWF